MKKLVFLILALALLIAGCTPSQGSIQTAIAQTLIIPTQTRRPTITPQATKTRIPTLTKVPTKRPTIAFQKTTYILETGWCMLDVSDVSGVDPKTVKYCNLDSREQLDLASNQEATITLNNLDGRTQVYCALFSLDGEFIMSDMDTTGTGKVTCRP